MPSRRDVLAVTGLTGLGIAGISQVRLGPINSWTPPPDTWPLRRYDPANTATNTAATAPTDPSVAWASTPLGVSRDNTVVADQETVYAAGNGIAALDRTDGTVRWQSNHPGGPLAVREGVVFIAPGYDVYTDDTALRAIGIDGVERWSRDLDSRHESPHADSLVVADDSLFVGAEGTIQAYGSAKGRLRWSAEDGVHTHVLVVDGQLHAASGSVVRYRRRSLLSVGLNSRGESAWETDYLGHPSGLAATDTRLVAGFHHSRPYGGPGLVGIDQRDGAIRWSAFHADNSAKIPFLAGPLATGSVGCFFGLLRGSGDSRQYAVASRRLSDGTRLWHRTISQRITDIAVVSETVLVATASSNEDTVAPSGTVRALHSRDGTEVWRVDLGDHVRSIAPVDGTVFAATQGGQIIALK